MHDDPLSSQVVGGAENGDCRSSPLLTVCLGASAGGLEALVRFLEAVPTDCGMAFVIVQHLHPDHESMMAELLGRRAAMPVAAVENGQGVFADRVYVLPPNRNLTVEGGRFRLQEPPRGERVTAPIDRFMRSLAAESRERAVGVVLSGTGADGSLGLREIKARGGMTLAQEPTDAEHDGMPRAAIATGAVDRIATIEEMPGILAGYARHPYVNGAPEAPLGTTGETADPLGDVLAVLRARTRFDFRSYKKSTLLRRVQRRMGLLRIDEYGKYIDLLRSLPDEAEQLFRDFLIGVTGFFREPEAFAALEKKVVPAIIKGKGEDGSIRIWVPACASGEEAYSVAMAFLEPLGAQNRTTLLQVFASDVDEQALDKARAGLYPETIVAELPSARLERFFTPEHGQYRVKQYLRDTVVFAKHNLIADPPFSKLDMISCRNLLIYLEPGVQNDILPLFHFALNDRGYLFLGGSESVATHRDLFEPISKKWQIHRRIGVTPAGAMDFLHRGLGAGPSVRAGDPGRHNEESDDIGQIARQALLAEHTPAAVVVNRKSEVLYYHGDTGSFLRPPVGEPTAELPAVVRRGLNVPVRSAIKRAVETDGRAVVSGARVTNGDDWFEVTVAATPIKRPREVQGLLVVTFEEERATPTDSAAADASQSDEPLVLGLERDLLEVREELQSVIEELESSNEELKASNEEMTSMNEELQSTNEELETSKGELQSLNEELVTVNAQLRKKVLELEEAHDDLANLFRSSEIATLFLDRDLKVKRFTGAIRSFFNLIPADAGRPIADLAPKFSDPDLPQDVCEVLAHLGSVECEIGTEEQRAYLRRVVPYRTQDDRIEGVVVIYTDITQLKEAQAELEKSRDLLEKTVERRTAFIDLLRRTAVAANRAVSVEAALDEILPEFCRHVGASFGQTWLIREGGNERLVARGPTFVSGARVDGLAAATPKERSIRDCRAEESVLRTGQVEWSTDLERTIGEDRAALARAAELHLAMIVPVATKGTTVGVLELLLNVAKERRQFMAELAIGVGSGIGQVIERIGMQKKLSDLSDEEQRRLGQELHDTVAQEIAGIRMLVEALRQKFEDGTPEAAAATELGEAAAKAQGHVRSLARGLVPAVIAAGGLRAAVENLAERIQTERGVSCEFLNPDELVVEESSLSTSLYYIAQEAVNNAVLHGEAKRVRIELREVDRNLTMRVVDDGKGFRVEDLSARGGSGLRIMAYRAKQMGGAFDVASEPGRGATVTVTIKPGWTEAWSKKS